MKKIIFALSIISIIISSCDKIDDPIPKDQGSSFSLDGETEYITDPSLGISNSEQLLDLINSNSWDSLDGYDNSNRRFIVLEEFTGHTCLNCPIGAAEVIRLDTILGDQLIPVSIHAGKFAEPKQTGDKYKSDHRPPSGKAETYATTFNPGDAYPRGMVSRIGGAVTPVNSWEGAINAIKDDNPKAVIKMRNFYSAASNLLRIDIEIEWLETLQEDYNLQVFVAEDHIIDWQLNITVDQPDYDHRHMLRKIVNDTWGKSLNEANQGETQKIQYILPLDPSWKANDLESIAFIYDSDVTSYEIIQANAAHVSE